MKTDSMHEVAVCVMARVDTHRQAHTPLPFLYTAIINIKRWKGLTGVITKVIFTTDFLLETMQIRRHLELSWLERWLGW